MNSAALIENHECQYNTPPAVQPSVTLTKRRWPIDPAVFRKLLADGCPKECPDYLLRAAGLDPFRERCTTKTALARIHLVRHHRGVVTS